MFPDDYQQSTYSSFTQNDISASFLINAGDQLASIIVAFIGHILLILIFRKSQKVKKYVKELFIYGLYTELVMGVYMEITFAVFVQFTNFDIELPVEFVNIIVMLIIALLMVPLPFFLAYVFKKYFHFITEEKNEKKFAFFWEGTKQDDIFSMSYNIYLIFRKLFFTFALVVFHDYTVVQLIFITLPTIFLGVFVFLRKPFINKNENLKQIAQEILLSLSAISIIVLKQYDDNPEEERELISIPIITIFAIILILHLVSTIFQVIKTVKSYEIQRNMKKLMSSLKEKLSALSQRKKQKECRICKSNQLCQLHPNQPTSSPPYPHHHPSQSNHKIILEPLSPYLNTPNQISSLNKNSNIKENNNSNIQGENISNKMVEQIINNQQNPVKNINTQIILSPNMTQFIPVELTLRPNEYSNSPFQNNENKNNSEFTSYDSLFKNKWSFNQLGTGKNTDENQLVQSPRSNQNSDRSQSRKLSQTYNNSQDVTNNAQDVSNNGLDVSIQCMQDQNKDLGSMRSINLETKQVLIKRDQKRRSSIMCSTTENEIGRDRRLTEELNILSNKLLSQYPYSSNLIIPENYDQEEIIPYNNNNRSNTDYNSKRNEIISKQQKYNLNNWVTQSNSDDKDKYNQTNKQDAKMQELHANQEVSSEEQQQQQNNQNINTTNIDLSQPRQSFPQRQRRKSLFTYLQSDASRQQQKSLFFNPKKPTEWD